jgi:hypothetical protein
MLLLGMIYILRSVGLAVYFYSAPTPETTLLFAAYIGFLWLGSTPRLRLNQRNVWASLASHAQRDRVHVPSARQFPGRIWWWRHL